MVMSPGHPGVIAVRDEADQTPTDLEMPEEIKGIKAAMYVWNPSTLAYERFQYQRRDMLMQIDLLEEILNELKILNKKLGEV
jgi:hypothetical protein